LGLFARYRCFLVSLIVAGISWGERPAIATTPPQQTLPWTAAEANFTRVAIVFPPGVDLLYPVFENSQPQADPPETVEEPLRLLVSLKERQVALYRGEQKVASYPIAIGRPGLETPKGTFKITEMVEEPIWEHPLTGALVMPGRSNPLGDRWIGFWSDGTNSFGFHGTPDENSIGHAVSHGCIRMKNRDIRLLFEQVKVGTTVIVKP
jgi:lipoprotein-anchoring transpeptidase ErfK/SrfK